MSAEGSGFEPEVLKSAVAPECLVADLLSFGRGSPRVMGVGSCGGWVEDLSAVWTPVELLCPSGCMLLILQEHSLRLL